MLGAKISKLSDNIKEMGEKMDNRFDKIDSRFTDLYGVRSELLSSGEATNLW